MKDYFFSHIFTNIAKEIIFHKTFSLAIYSRYFSSFFSQHWYTPPTPADPLSDLNPVEPPLQISGYATDMQLSQIKHGRKQIKCGDCSYKLIEVISNFKIQDGSRPLYWNFDLIA